MSRLGLLISLLKKISLFILLPSKCLFSQMIPFGFWRQQRMRFVAINGGSAVAVTANGASWSQATTGGALSAIDWNGTIYCATSTATNFAYTSKDALVWTLQVMSATASWSAICWNSSIFCAIAGGPGVIASTSSDGINWTAGTLANSLGWQALAWNGTVY